LKTILLTGKNGQVGHELVTALAPQGRVVATGREQLDLARPDSIVSCVREVRPDIIVNAAGFTAVDKAQADPETAQKVNADAPGIMAEEARRTGALLLHYSTDYVFDGSKGSLYCEYDPPNPINVYGRTKLTGEKNIMASGCRHLILRASWIYSARGTNFVLTMLGLARKHPRLAVVADQIGSPTAAAELSSATARILLSPRLSAETCGIYHCSASGHVSRFEFAKTIIAKAKLASRTADGWAEITATTTAEYPLPAQRPLNAATDKGRLRERLGVELPHWQDQLQQFLETLPKPILLQCGEPR